MHLKQKTPLNRVIAIVKKIYEFESLHVDDLAFEFDVSTRTIHRDFKTISQIINLKNHKGIYSLDLNTHQILGNKLNSSLIASFANNIEINIECIEKSNKEYVKFAMQYKNLPKKLGEQIINAIDKEVVAFFDYKKDDGITQRNVAPIKIFFENSRWYMQALDYKDNIIKSFLLTKIENFKSSDKKAIITAEQYKDADSKKSVWSSPNNDKIIVRLYAFAKIVNYLKDIKLHYTQTIEDLHANGDIELRCEITHELELLPAIKSWLPYIHIIEPQWLRDKLSKDLSEFYYEDMHFDI